MAHLAMPGGTGITHDVAIRRFNLDYLGAEITQDLRRQRPEDNGRQVEHLDPGERTWFGLAHRTLKHGHPPVVTSSGHRRDFIRVSKRRIALLKKLSHPVPKPTTRTCIKYFILLQLQQICSKFTCKS